MYTNIFSEKYAVNYPLREICIFISFEITVFWKRDIQLMIKLDN